eukprot:755607-Hanusia_phi.AAC.2
MSASTAVISNHHNLALLRKRPAVRAVAVRRPSIIRGVCADSLRPRVKRRRVGEAKISPFSTRGLLFSESRIALETMKSTSLSKKIATEVPKERSCDLMKSKLSGSASHTFSSKKTVLPFKDLLSQFDLFISNLQNPSLSRRILRHVKRQILAANGRTTGGNGDVVRGFEEDLTKPWTESRRGSWDGTGRASWKGRVEGKGEPDTCDREEQDSKEVRREQEDGALMKAKQVGEGDDGMERRTIRAGQWEHSGNTRKGESDTRKMRRGGGEEKDGERRRGRRGEGR